MGLRVSLSDVCWWHPVVLLETKPVKALCVLFLVLMLSLPHGIAQGVALEPDCGWSKGLDWLFLVAASIEFPNKQRNSPKVHAL